MLCAQIMNDQDRHERQQNLFRFAKKAALPTEVMLYFLLVMSACFWWYGGPDKEIGIVGGAVSTIGLWVYTFNQLPTFGINCIRHPKVMFFQLPFTLIATVGFLVGIYIT